MGKSSSKLNKKKSQSVAWNFRFASWNRKLASTWTSNGGQLLYFDIKEWLTIINLPQYESHFKKFLCVNELLMFTVTDIKRLGITDPDHLNKIATSLAELRDRSDTPSSLFTDDENSLRKSTMKRNHRHSVAVTNRIKSTNESPTYELLQVNNTKQKQSKSLDDLLDMNESTELKKALEWELSLDSRDLRSHAWYHGPIPRLRAEEIVQKDGDFLIRDCTSQPGNFVLTCFTNGTILHFVINKLVIQPETVYERYQYQFEDDAYDTLPDLITFYVGSGRPISLASGARIQFPCNRTYPLSYYATVYGPSQSNISMGSPMSSPLIPNNGFSQAPSPPYKRKDLPPRIPAKPMKAQPLTVQRTESLKNTKYFSADGVIKGDSMIENKTNSLSRIATSRGVSQPATKSSTLPRMDLNLKRTSSMSESIKPPPKPQKFEPENSGDKRQLNRGSSYHTSGSDSGNGSGDSVQSSTPCDGTANPLPPHGGGVVIRDPRRLPNSASSVTLKNFTEFDMVAAEEKLMAMECSEYEQESIFDLENYMTLLLPCVDNKPLDSGALNKFRSMLYENSPRLVAMHMSRVDIDLIIRDFRETKVEESRKPPFIGCGLELIGMPFGEQYRFDLLERIQCIRLLVGITILTCPTNEDRAETFDKWIQVAIELKNSLGNLFGFASIMLGLCMPQIEKLYPTWNILRQKYTDSAFTFESKLRPMLKNMNDCSNPQAPNTIIPHLLPYLLFRDRQLINDVLDFTNSKAIGLANSCLTSWEKNTADFGLSVMWMHVDGVRSFSNNLQLYKRNAQIALADKSNRYDELLEDAFRTEFHMKFLWGSRGALSPADERHQKMEQLLSLMAERFCSGVEETK